MASVPGAVPSRRGPPGPAAGVLDEHLRRTADGDRIAFRALYDVLLPCVHDSATCLFGHGDRAAHLTAAVFLDVWRLAHEYRPGGDGVHTWVLGIAGRHTMTRHRPAAAPDEFPSQKLDALLRGDAGPASPTVRPRPATPPRRTPR